MIHSAEGKTMHDTSTKSHGLISISPSCMHNVSGGLHMERMDRLLVYKCGVCVYKVQTGDVLTNFLRWDLTLDRCRLGRRWRWSLRGSLKFCFRCLVAGAAALEDCKPNRTYVQMG